jgi:hypothetical protein
MSTVTISMTAVLTAKIREQITGFVDLGRAPKKMTIGEKTRDIRDTRDDINRFYWQNQHFGYRQLPQYVVDFRSGLSSDRVSVPLEAPRRIGGWGIFPDSYDTDLYTRQAETMRDQGASIHEASSTDCRGIFIDRLAEFVRTRFLSPPPSPPKWPPSSDSDDLTVVETLRQGVNVIYAKGYFISTKTAFGRATPARRYLPPGRYSFGVLDKHTPRFAYILWEVPSIDVIKLDLP